MQARRTSWEHVIPFLALPEDLRRAVYTTDESVKSSEAVGVGFRGSDRSREVRARAQIDFCGPPCRGGRPEARVTSWQKGMLPTDDQTKEVFAGVDRARLRLALESDRPVAHIAHDLGIHPETLRKKLRQHETDAGKRPDLPTSQEREEVRRLRRENHELRRANAIVESASVFFAKKLDPDRTK